MLRTILLLTLGMGALTAAEPISEIRVLTWNLHHGVGEDGKLDLERIAKVILDAKPDIVALQEVDSDCHRSGHVDQTAELAKLTGMHGAFGAAMPYDGGEYGQAILSRYPLAQTAIHRLPGEGEPRIAFEATVSIDGKPLRMITVHLSYEQNDRRLKQVQSLIKALAKSPTPSVLAGDFNDVPKSPALKLLDDAWLAVPKAGNGLTSPANKPRAEIDHIYLRGLAVKGTAEVLAESVASDHRPVMAVIIPKIATQQPQPETVEKSE